VTCQSPGYQAGCGAKKEIISGWGCHESGIGQRATQTATNINQLLLCQTTHYQPYEGTRMLSTLTPHCWPGHRQAGREEDEPARGRVGGRAVTIVITSSQPRMQQDALHSAARHMTATQHTACAPTSRSHASCPNSDAKLAAAALPRAQRGRHSWGCCRFRLPGSFTMLLGRWVMQHSWAAGVSVRTRTPSSQSD